MPSRGAGGIFCAMKNHIHAAALSLGVSDATIRNWLRGGKLATPGGGVPANAAEIAAAAEQFVSAGNRLTGRANRSRSEHRCAYPLDGNAAGRRWLRETTAAFRDSGIGLESALAELARRRLEAAGLLTRDWRRHPRSRIERMLNRWLETAGTPPAELFSGPDPVPETGDPLGAFYLSGLELGRRSQPGAFYTPEALCRELGPVTSGRLCDPCCGSGGLLLAAAGRNFPPEQLFACDNDPIALRLCLINCALFFADPDCRVTVEQRDLFTAPPPLRFEQIVTNPPWGGRVNGRDRFDAALRAGLRLLTPGGELQIFLPRAFLNVERHRQLRRDVFSSGINAIRLCGAAFPGVMSEAVLLRHRSGIPAALTASRPGTAGYRLCADELFTTFGGIPPDASAAEIALLRRLARRSDRTLRGRARFALGIVTGSNAEFLSSEPAPDRPGVLRGRDIHPFYCDAPTVFLAGEPARLRQCADPEIYRRPKIVYRFVADRVICAIDRSGVLPLNSANVFVPEPGYPWESIAALFNSSLYGFIFRKRFAAAKVLRSHLEALPLPELPAAAHAELRAAAANRDLAAVDRIVNAVFELSAAERRLVKT